MLQITVCRPYCQLKILKMRPTLGHYLWCSLDGFQQDPFDDTMMFYCLSICILTCFGTLFRSCCLAIARVRSTPNSLGKLHCSSTDMWSLSLYWSCPIAQTIHPPPPCSRALTCLRNWIQKSCPLAIMLAVMYDISSEECYTSIHNVLTLRDPWTTWSSAAAVARWVPHWLLLQVW